MSEGLKRQLQGGEMGEQTAEAFLEAKQQMMLDNLWKLNVVDIEMTLSHVCQAVCLFCLIPASYYRPWVNTKYLIAAC